MNNHVIPDSYWVIPRLLLGGRVSRRAHGCGGGHSELRALLNAGVRVFVNLTEAGEYGLRPYWPRVQELAAERVVQVAHQRLSIPDMGAPEPAHMLAILNAIDGSLAAGRPVYVHCFGGIGRTGTVVGCHFVRHGRQQARRRSREITARRRQGTPDGYRQSPETEEQRKLVLASHEE